MRVAIIGGGAAGLASLKNILDCGFQADVFEMRPVIGGTWAYTDEVGKDRYGYPVHSAMYKGLSTNLPKEVMGFPDFPIPENDRSYLSQTEILNFLDAYADHFGLRQHVQCNTIVSKIEPLGDRDWKVTCIHKPTNQTITNIYNAVMICNGHYNEPTRPTLPGQENFAGKIDHSQNFRDADRFKGERVLVIGAGPSGLDITLHISEVAKHVVLSHHSPDPINSKYPSNVDLKPDVKRIVDSSKVEFVDGSCCCFDEILFCTGYKYSLPFLDDSCHITVENNHIQLLYKHIINIERPTMCFIGVPYNVCAFHMSDLQARFFCKYLTGSMPLPSKDEMRMHTKKDIEHRKGLGYTQNQMHMMGTFQQAYYDDLANDAKTAPIPPVLVKLRDHSVKRLYDDLLNFRKDVYKIVDDHNFVKVSN